MCIAELYDREMIRATVRAHLLADIPPARVREMLIDAAKTKEVCGLFERITDEEFLNRFNALIGK